MPPSPRLSARRIRSAYLIEMIRISAHRISDTTPRIGVRASAARHGRRPWPLPSAHRGAGADVAIDDAEGADRGCQWERAEMAGGCDWRTGHWRPPLASRPPDQPKGAINLPVCDETPQITMGLTGRKSPASFARYGVRSAVTRRASRIDWRLGAGDAEAGSFEIRPGLLRAVPADRADVQPVALGEAPAVRWLRPAGQSRAKWSARRQ